MEERELRDLKAKIAELEEKFVPVSKADLEKRWVAVRETMDEFTAKLVETELTYRGHADTLAKILRQQQMIMEMLAAQSVQIQDLQEQLNTTTTALADHIISGTHKPEN